MANINNNNVQVSVASEGDINGVGYRLDTAGTDHFDAVTGFTSLQTGTSWPSNAPDEMTLLNDIQTFAPIVLALFVQNTS